MALPSLLDPGRYTDPGAPLPLGRHVFVDTHDPAEARELTSRLFAPHRLEMTTRRGFHALNHHVRLNRLSLYAIRYATDVEISSAAMRNFYLLLAPVRGECRVSYGSREWDSRPGTLSMVNPHEAISLGWGGGCIQLVIKIDRQAVEDSLEALHGRPPGAVSFRDGEPVPHAGCGGLVRMMDLLFSDQDKADPAVAHRPSETAAEALFLNLLVREFPGSHQRMESQEQSRVAPHYVKRVEEFLRLHAGERITVADMVSVSGVSERTLYHGFRTFRGMGPRAYLNRIRLEYVRADLAAAAAGRERATVTEVAHRWGFTHAGNFGQAYKALFGETPSETLRQAGAARILQPSG